MPIKDRDAISVIQAKLLGSSLAKGFLDGLKVDPDVPPTSMFRPRLQSFSYAGQKIFYLPCPPFASAWCATDHELIVAATPQNVMAYLRHDPAHESLATVPQVGRLIARADAPGMMVYVDTPKLFELVYPFVPLAASFGSSFGADRLPFDAIPSAPAIGRHLVPGTAALRRTKQGLELVSRQPLPGTGLLWTGLAGYESAESLEKQVAAEGQPRNEINPLGPAAVGAYTTSSPPARLGLPASADRSLSLAVTRLSALGSGVKAYRDKHRTMPPAYLADKHGKPLLSWRVALLPYLGRQDLYTQFHLDEPWDGPHNRKLLPLMPDIYRDPDAAPNSQATPTKPASPSDEEGKTRFLLVRGPKTVYADPAPPMPGTYEEWLKAIVVVVRSDRAVPWTSPDEFTYQPKDPRGSMARFDGIDPVLQAGGEVSEYLFSDAANRSSEEEHERACLRRVFTGEEPSPAAAPPPSTCPPAPAPPSTKN